MLETIKNFVLSSTGEGLSLRFQSLCAGLFPLLLALSPVLGLGLTSEDLEGFKLLVLEVLATAMTLAATVQHINGWLRHNFYKKAELGRFKLPDED